MTRRTMVKPDPSCLFMSFFLQVVAPILTNFILWKMTSKKSQEESRNYWPVNDPPEEKSSLPTFPIGFLRSTSIYALNAKLRSQSRIFDDDVDFDYPFSSGCFLGDFPLATKAFQVNQTRRDAKIWGLRGEKPDHLLRFRKDWQTPFSADWSNNNDIVHEGVDMVFKGH